MRKLTVVALAVAAFTALVASPASAAVATFIYMV